MCVHQACALDRRRSTSDRSPSPAACSAHRPHAEARGREAVLALTQGRAQRGARASDRARRVKHLTVSTCQPWQKCRRRRPGLVPATRAIMSTVPDRQARTALRQAETEAQVSPSPTPTPLAWRTPCFAEPASARAPTSCRDARSRACGAPSCCTPRGAPLVMHGGGAHARAARCHREACPTQPVTERAGRTAHERGWRACAAGTETREDRHA
jgi:hypothetical protein